MPEKKKVPTCPICKSTKVTVDEASKMLIRCGNCGWNKNRIRKTA